MTSRCGRWSSRYVFDAIPAPSTCSEKFTDNYCVSQVEILQLENALSSARHKLGEMRKISYQDED